MGPPAWPYVVAVVGAFVLGGVFWVVANVALDAQARELPGSHCARRVVPAEEIVAASRPEATDD